MQVRCIVSVVRRLYICWKGCGREIIKASTRSSQYGMLLWPHTTHQNKWNTIMLFHMPLLRTTHTENYHSTQYVTYFSNVIKYDMYMLGMAECVKVGVYETMTLIQLNHNMIYIWVCKFCFKDIKRTAKSHHHAIKYIIWYMLHMWSYFLWKERNGKAHVTYK